MSEPTSELIQTVHLIGKMCGVVMGIMLAKMTREILK